MLHFTIPQTITDIKISDFLRQRGISLTLRRKIKHRGQVLLNGETVRLATVACAGDDLKIILPAQPKLIPTELPLNIAYEDADLLVLNKPAGMLVHPSTKMEHTTLANAVLYYYQQQQLDLDYHPVHRLDRNTSGLILIAKHPYIQHYLCHESIKSLNRFYRAVITGVMPTVDGIINAPIGRSPDSIIRRVVTPDGQTAITKYTTIADYGSASLLDIELLTGRTHQIRAHFAAVGHPLLGDDLYGGSTELINRQALHAAKLIFRHPVSGETITITADLPSDIKHLLTHLAQKDRWE